MIMMTPNTEEQETQEIYLMEIHLTMEETITNQRKPKVVLMVIT